MIKMFKTISFLSTLIFLTSCGKSSSGDSGAYSSTGDAIQLEEVSLETPVPSAALNFDVSLELYKFNANQEDKVLAAADLIRKVVASEEFKNAILKHTYKGKRQFVDNGGLTNAQIYKKIIEGSERLNPGIDNVMNLDLEVFTRAGSTVGYTYPSKLRVWMNSKYLNKNSPAKVTTNMMHEWLHKLGFKHDQKKTAKRPYSVPYAVGYLTARLAKKHT